MKEVETTIDEYPATSDPNVAPSNVSNDPEGSTLETLKPSAWDNKLAVVVTWFTFLMFGLSDGTTGALLPSIQKDYNVSYTVVSLIFFCQILGYGILGLGSTYVLSRVGRLWGVLAGGALFMMGLAILTANTPHFAGIVLGYILLGFAAGFFESILNAFFGSFRESNVILGCLHGFYGLGAAVAPISVTQWIAAGLPWYRWYAVLLGLAGFMTTMIAIAFRKHSIAYCAAEDALASKRHTDLTAEDTPRRQKTPVMAALTNKFCLVGAFYMFCYLAMEISTGGFVLTFLTNVRGASEPVAGYANTGFWLGLTLGRFLLTPAANIVGAWLGCQLFTAMSLFCILGFWLAPTYVGSSIGIALTGFFLGPTFPLIIQLATDYLPPRLHVAGIGLIASIGSMGGAIFPLVVGVIATSRGPKAIPPILVALLVALLAVWMMLPGPKLVQLTELTKRALRKHSG
ncbi:major facilitator superfamily domain-containing protein [Protomyces lactucae-debilis]|uniref:Major facilitator superfamily domain-containing protein n=1 Tax=Protomyces lactucae-debilis TaxID=2754530 RepID=A0A1Y2FIE6_PROLT|nr:major facilitator superfamily domain-containing protein [Protomyces lactucae-debilis]ORY83732.1 major facilitator superfamily domain-containing protein [Protomyces lactucae-debilis]